METGNRLTAARRKGVGGEWQKKEKGIFSQRRCMNDPWIWTTVWGQTVGVGVGLDGGGQRVNIGTTVIE